MQAPYPSDTRAKGWRFELDHERIRQSDTWALASPELRPWLLMLWMVAWEQTPCGSLPDDDALIAARLGMPAKSFTKHRAVLLRGWEQADDGKLYHPTITQRVLEMLARRRKEADRKAAARARTSPDDHGSPAEVPDVSRGTSAGLHPESDTGTGTGETSTMSGRRKPRGSRLPADWTPGETGFAFAAHHGLTNGKAQAELDRFRDHWAAKTGADAVKADWQATWRNWVRRAVELQPRRDVGPGRPSDPFAGAH